MFWTLFYETDKYRTDFSVPHGETENSHFDNNVVNLENNIDIRRKRGRPRKIVSSNNLFETRRDENCQNEFSNSHLNITNNLTNDLINDPILKNANDNNALISQRLTRSSTKNLSEPEKEKYFQSLNLIEDKNINRATVV